MYLNKKVGLVTGATGFAGFNLTKKLLADGWVVHVVVRNTSEISFLKELGANIHVFDGSYGSVDKIISSCQPDIVFHLAAWSLPMHKPDDIQKLLDSNITFGTFLLEAMAKNKINKFINIGTSWQHFNNDVYNPVCLYAATKQAFQDIMRYYQESKKIFSMTLVLYDTYGNNDNRKKVLNLLKKSILNDEQLVMTKGDQLIDIVHIDDVIRCIMLACAYLLEDSKSIGNEYAVSSNKPITLKELVEIIENTVKKKANIIWGGIEYREREVMIPWNKGKTLPGWKPMISIEDGMKLFFNIYQKT